MGAAPRARPGQDSVDEARRTRTPKIVGIVGDA